MANVGYRVSGTSGPLTVATGTTPFDVTGLSAGDYEVYSLSDTPQTVTVAGSATAPAQVTGLVATGGDTQVSLSWSAPSNGGAAITDYQIERQIAGGGFITISDGVSTATSFVDTGRTNGLLHEYRVSAINSVGTGPASTVASATPSASATVPAQVTGLIATPGDTQVSLAWSAPSDGGSPITDYVIEFSTGGSFTTISDGTSTATSFTHTSLTNGTEHTYRVSAVNSVGQGTASATASATPAASSSVAIVERSRGVSGALVANSYTFNNLAIGTGTVFLSTVHRNGLEATAVTLGGAAMTLVGTANDGIQGTSCWRLDGQTAGTVSASVSLSTNAGRCGVALWTVTGAGASVAGLDVAFEDISGIRRVTTDIATTNGGVLLAYGSQIQGTGNAPTWTGVTPTTAIEEISPNFSHSIAEAAVSSTGIQTVSMDAVSFSNLQMLSVISVAPA